MSVFEAINPHRKLADSQLADSQLADSQLADSQLADSQLADSQLADSQLADSQLADSQLADSQYSRPLCIYPYDFRVRDFREAITPDDACDTYCQNGAYCQNA